MTGTPSAIDDQKRLLRDRARKARFALDAEERHAMSRACCERLIDLLRLRRTILVYCAKEHEVQTLPLIEALLAGGTRVVVPIIERETVTLRLSFLDDPSVLVESTFRVPEPIGRELAADVREVEAAVVPMLAFDAEGNRLGYGAGYYDRFLTSAPWIERIGVAYACQAAERIPADDRDATMDWIVTNEAVLRCNHGSRHR
jgi:5-formyltetrahydrofolate cyclo-ligase